MKILRRGKATSYYQRLAATVSVLILSLSIPAVVTPRTAAAAALTPRMVGVTAITLRTDSVRQRQYDAIKAEGFQAVRLIIEWPIIEPAPGQFNWASTDTLVVDAFNRGLTILGVVTYTPAWAATAAGRNFLHPGPADPNAYGNFVNIAAHRYRGIVRNWEIWNEPNIVQSFAPNPDIPLYSAMLKSAYSAIKAIDPYSVVITGGTSPAIDGPGSIAPANFINGLYQNGAGNSFDAVGMHPYSSPDLLSTDGPYYSSHAAIGYVNYVLSYRGQGYKKLWFTEFGASTANTQQPGADPTGQQSGVTEARQAEILVDGINYMRSLPNCGPIFVFDHRDFQTGSPNVEYNYGLLRSDFSAKPALGAVQRLLAAV
jgi:hypothetical protein